MDARQLEFPENLFDVVLDKGTLDSILVGTFGDFAFNLEGLLEVQQRRLEKHVLCGDQRNISCAYTIISSKIRCMNSLVALDHFQKP